MWYRGSMSGSKIRICKAEFEKRIRNTDYDFADPETAVTTETY